MSTRHDFSVWRYINREVGAIKFTIDTAPKIISLLLNEVAQKTITRFELNYDRITQTYVITFAYAEALSRVITIQSETHYLVRLSDGTLTVWDIDSFESEFTAGLPSIETDEPVTDVARTDYTVLSE